MLHYLPRGLVSKPREVLAEWETLVRMNQDAGREHTPTRKPVFARLRAGGVRTVQGYFLRGSLSRASARLASMMRPSTIFPRIAPRTPRAFSVPVATPMTVGIRRN